MPELPEVQTTVNGLNSTVKGRTITSVSTTYNSPYYHGRDEIKNPKFFTKFKKLVVGSKIIKAERRAKNILIHLSNKHTILIHMKMTGHLLYEGYKKDPFNSHIRLYFKFDNGKHLYFSDMRRFAKVTIIETDKLTHSIHLSHLGPEPLTSNFKLTNFKTQLLKRPRGRIKQVLMDQTLIAGIGNIYSDEILWRAGVHPLSQVEKIPEKNFKEMFAALKRTLQRGIDFGGDSMSDYRNIKGEKGKFQEHHQAYRRTGKPCTKKGCKGKISRMVVATRSAHFCDTHQKLYA